MQHENCIEAIRKHQTVSAKQSNVNTNREECQCSHKPSVCNWVGNSIHYACLHQETTAPQRVYAGMSATKTTSITSQK